MNQTLTSYDTQQRTVGESRCQNCGAFVTTQFARVFGDNEDKVHGCFDCMSATRVKNGHANGN